MRQLVNPCPSVAAGKGPFLIRDNSEDDGGRCAPPSKGRAGLFQSPFSVSTPLALGIRAHEYGHLGLFRQKLVPSLRSLNGLRRSGVHEAWIQGTLDVVVNSFMMAQGNRDISELVLWMNGLERKLPRWIAATLYLRAMGLRHSILIRMSILARQTGLEKDDLDTLDETSKRLAAWGKSARRIPRHEYNDMLTCLQRRFGPEPSEACYPSLRIGLSIPFGKNHWEAEKLEDELDREIRKMLARRGIDSEEGENADGWGPMDVLIPPLRGKCSRGRVGVRTTRACGYSGPFLFPSRALIPASDGRAFMERRSRCRQLGTLLIDCSGSMRNQVTHDRIIAVLASAPSSTIALYAGRPGNQSGTLLIAASKGMHITEDVLSKWENEGNVVDGPALQWLSRQRTPRVWISDGEVTGLNDISGADLRSEVEILTTAARIRRFETLDAFLADEKWK